MYSANRKQARNFIVQLGAGDKKLPREGKSLFLCLPGVAWRIDCIGKDQFIVYQVEV